MPEYRLLAGHATVLELFNAPDDREAGLSARELAMEFPQHGRLPARRSDFRVERLEGGRWRFVLSWVPADLGGFEVMHRSSRAAS